MRSTPTAYRVAWRWRRFTILLTLVAVVAATGPRGERLGDRLQIALPLLGLGCSVLTGGAGEYLLRFAALETFVHGSKAGLGAAGLNQRPDGSGKGFPSGHTAAASFGTSALVHECLRNSPVTGTITVVAAGFTGASRIGAGAHDIWQVLAGVLYGWGVERILRQNGPIRRRISAAFSRWRVRRRNR